MEEKRRHPRVETVNLISYIGVDKYGNQQSQGMGTALNISKNGLLIESTRKIDSDFISLLSNDRENNLIEVEGKVVYSRQAPSGRFETGICFQGTHEENIQFIMSLVKVFNFRKYNIHSSCWNKIYTSNPFEYKYNQGADAAFMVNR